MIKNATVPKQKSIKFFIMMLPAFLALVNPASTIANPACIKNTKAALIRYHIPNTSVKIFSIIFPPLHKEKRHLQSIYFMNHKHLCLMYVRILFSMKQFVNYFLKHFENFFPYDNNSESK